MRKNQINFIEHLTMCLVEMFKAKYAIEGENFSFDSVYRDLTVKILRETTMHSIRRNKEQENSMMSFRNMFYVFKLDYEGKASKSNLKDLSSLNMNRNRKRNSLQETILPETIFDGEIFAEEVSVETVQEGLMDGKSGNNFIGNGLISKMELILGSR